MNVSCGSFFLNFLSTLLTRSSGTFPFPYSSVPPLFSDVIFVAARFFSFRRRHLMIHSLYTSRGNYSSNPFFSLLISVTSVVLPWAGL